MSYLPVISMDGTHAFAEDSMPKICIHNIIIAALLFLSACSDVGGFEGGDQGSADMQAPSEDMSRPVDMSSTCDPTPKVEACMGVCGEQPDGCGGTHDCGAPRAATDICSDACGMQPDGCGGMIECAPCACENGAPLQATCGPCNLGTASCDEQDSFSCVLPPIPDMETLNCELDLVYVWDEYFGTIETGTKEEPFKSLKDATNAANANGSRAILIRGANTYGDGPFLITGGLSLVGGFGEDWKFDQAIRPMLSNQTEEGQDSIGIEAKDITSPAVVYNLTVATEDAPNSANNYGMIADTANRLSIINVHVSAGAAGDGKAGISGYQTARNGVDGEDGLPGQTVPQHDFASYQCAPSVNKDTPVNSVPVINPPCDDPLGAGGAGGAGACEEHTGRPGESSAQEIQGGGIYNGPITRTELDGIDGHNNTLDPLGPNTAIEPADFGSKGVRGQVSGARWDLTVGFGGDGSDGATGRGGGGGGGAREQDSPYASGPSGGSGGHGGCGGQRGTGGTPGGSSFGLFAVNSVGLKITEDSSFTSGTGGKGGRGGNGGVGGQGGKGGKGTNQACEAKENPLSGQQSQSNCITLPYKSGDGGDGAPGLPGGPGGGGAGGDSFGIYCHESNLAIDPSTNIGHGTAGMGGRGGEYGTHLDQSLPQPEQDGEDGQASATQGCD